MHRSSKGPGFAAVGAGLVLGVAGTVLPNGPLPAQVRDAPAITEELGSDVPLAPFHTRSVRIGLIRDTRDHEAVARSGSWTELLVQRHVRSFGGEADFTRWTIADRRFVPVTSSFTFANRVLVQDVRGDAPPHELVRIQSSFREQEGLGGAKTVRGLPQNRYVGDALVLWNAELRWEGPQARVLGLGFRPGVVAFVDSARLLPRGGTPLLMKTQMPSTRSDFRWARPRCALAVPACLIGMFLSSACATVPLPDRLSGGVGGSISWKEVVTKHGPGTPRALDGTECVVPREPYQRISTGDCVFCLWVDPRGRRGGLPQRISRTAAPENPQASGSSFMHGLSPGA